MPVINLTHLSFSALAFLIALDGKIWIYGLTLSGIFLIIFVSLCIYFGNAASVRANNCAPNPGYSAAINKSYVVITVIASVFLFNAQFSWQKIFAVILIIASQFLIIGKKQQTDSGADRNWVFLSFVAFFSYAFLTLSVKHANVNLGINQSAFLFWATLISLTYFISEASIKKISFFNYKKQVESLLLLGVLSGFANVFMFNALVSAPNMGYVNAINAATAALTALLAVKIFKDELTFKKSLGIIGVMLGVILIVL